MKYLSLLLIGAMMQIAAVHAGGCKDGCKKPKTKTVLCCNKDKKGDKKAHKKNRDKNESAKTA